MTNGSSAYKLFCKVRSLAYQILYRAVKKIKQKTEINSLLVLRQAIRRVTSNIKVSTRHNKKESTQKVPIEIASKKSTYVRHGCQESPRFTFTISLSVVTLCSSLSETVKISRIRSRCSLKFDHDKNF